MPGKVTVKSLLRGIGLCSLVLLSALPGHTDELGLHVPDPAQIHLLLSLDLQAGAAAALGPALMEALASPQLADIQLAVVAPGDTDAMPEYRRPGEQRGVLASVMAAELGLVDGDETGAADASAAGALHLQLLQESPPQEADSCADFRRLRLSSAPLPGGVTLPMADPVALRRDLQEILLGLVSRSGSLVSAVGPLVGSDAAGMSRDVYLGMFEARPRIGWRGNLKKLKVVTSGAPDAVAAPDGNPPALAAVVDSRGATGLLQEGPLRGQIDVGATTFWTHAGDLPPALTGDEAAAAVDGASVARGGAGQNIPGLRAGAGTLGDFNGPGSRQLFTEAETGSALLPLNADLPTANELGPWLGTEDPLEALDLLRWLRGWEDDEDSSRAREWLLGEVLHSRPLGINYGAVGAGYTVANPNIRVLFGSGDGFLRVLENTDAEGGESGRELYGFMPRELLANVALRRDGALPATRLRHGVDGSPVALIKDLNGDGRLRAEDGDEVLVYFGLRRGGYSYYALDISDPARPPRLQWVIARTEGGDFDELGLTYSTPVPGKVKYGGASRDVLIFGGGYQDRGNAVYIVDARSGELVWKAVQGITADRSNRHYAHAELRDSIPADLAALTDSAGYIHRLYVGDTGGRIWRIDVPPGHAGDANHRAERWSVSLFAELGGPGADDRRFFHAPELVQTRSEQGQMVDGVLISSGNRADPAAAGVADFHFYLKDYLSTSGDPALPERPPIRLTDLDDQTACSGMDTSCGGSLIHGWKIALTAPGEKGLGKPLVDAGRVFMSSFTPSADPCAQTPGEGKLYVMALADGSPLVGDRRAHVLGDGMPAEMLRIGAYFLLPSGGLDASVDTGDTLLSGPLQRSLAPRLLKIYWRQPGIDRL
ncbi:MAG: pilus assembly protein [Haliea sp.]